MNTDKVICPEAGSCPVCHLQYMGHEHNCPGPELPQYTELMGVQFMEDIDAAVRREPRRNFSRRLAEGFALLHGDKAVEWD